MRLAHVVFRTADLATMRNWYVKVLGAEVVFEDRRGCFLSCDEEHHRIALISDPTAPAADPAAVGFDHVAFALPSLENLIACYERLAALGLLPVWEVDHGPTTSLYYLDPDGNRVELQIDNFDTRDQLVGWFRSDAFARNPIGTPIDFRGIAARHRVTVDAPNRETEMNDDR